MSEPFTITSNGQTWTRATRVAAQMLADRIHDKTGHVAVVTLTETGWVEYVSESGKSEEVTHAD